MALFERTVIARNAAVPRPADLRDRLLVPAGLVAGAQLTDGVSLRA